VKATDALLSVQGLTIGFRSTSGDLVTVVDDVSFDIHEGEAVGLVGESGCGKTVTAVSILGLLPGTGRIEAGSILFRGRDLANLSEKQLRGVRGAEIGFISQEPMISLNPTFRVGSQLAEVVRCHQRVSRSEARTRALGLLRDVHLPDPEAVARRYPHELSGGMAQRVAIARALAGKPRLLIADEPTTALDVTVQAEILDLLGELQQARGMAILLVTHDWGVIADLCERAIVMYAGEVVERAALVPMFREPRHPYTEALLAANPHHAPEAAVLPSIPGSVPQPGQWPEGCHFHPRCGYATRECAGRRIPLEVVDDSRETRCIHHSRLAGLNGR
jgi:peptide/nickel transport system permease protein